MVELKKVKKTEEDRHRHLQQLNTAHNAKKEFIEANYDYTSTPDEMNLDIFRKVVNSN